MFKINIHEIEPNKYRIRHKATGLAKTISLSETCKPSFMADLLAYNIFKGAKELMLDLLYSKYGDDYRSVGSKHHKSIERSIMRAVKFAK